MTAQRARAPFPAAIDATAVRDFRSCPQKFNLAHILKLVPRTADSPDLIAGGAFAAGLEAARLAFYRDQLSAKRARNLGLIALMREYGDYEPPENHVKSLPNTISAFVYYLETWPFETDALQPYFAPSGAPAVEFTFAIPLNDCPHPETGEPLLYAGRFDMLGILDGLLCGVDEKTTKGIGPYWLQQWDMRSQFIGYCWAAQQLDFPVGAFLVRGISILKTEHHHAQVILKPSEFLISRWRNQLTRDVRRMTQLYLEGYFDYNLDEACAMYGGCQYKVLCSSASPETWLPDYVKREWDPLAKNPSQEAQSAEAQSAS